MEPLGRSDDGRSAGPEGSDGSPGRQLGRYRIVSRLPSSDARDLFVASDGSDGRVVIEVLAAPKRSNGLVNPKIAQEASVYAHLSHPNVLRVVDLFLTDASFVIALEHIDGAPLEQMRGATNDMTRTQADACWIYVACRVLDALAAAHRARDASGNPAPLFHRRVSPSTVQITWDGTVKLAHFDVGNVTAVLRPRNPRSAWRRSLPYLAPEQIKLRRAVAASDVYATMLVLWELLAGRLPNMMPLERIRPDLDARVLEAIRVGLRVDPETRAMSAAQVRDLLGSAIDEGAACHLFTEAVARLRATQQAPTVAPPMSHERLRIPDEAQLASPPPSPLAAIQPPPRPADVPAPPSSHVRPARLPIYLAMTAAACILVLAAFAALPGGHAGGASGPQATPARMVVAAAAPARSAVTAVAPVVEEIPSDVGELRLPASAAEHRIYVDQRVVSQGAAPVRVKCGWHAVRIGSAGRTRNVRVPCGQSLALRR